MGEVQTLGMELGRLKGLAAQEDPGPGEACRPDRGPGSGLCRVGTDQGRAPYRGTAGRSRRRPTHRADRATDVGPARPGHPDQRPPGGLDGRHRPPPSAIGPGQDRGHRADPEGGGHRRVGAVPGGAPSRTGIRSRRNRRAGTSARAQSPKHQPANPRSLPRVRHRLRATLCAAAHRLLRPGRGSGARGPLRTAQLGLPSPGDPARAPLVRADPQPAPELRRGPGGAWAPRGISRDWVPGSASCPPTPPWSRSGSALPPEHPLTPSAAPRAPPLGLRKRTATRHEAMSDPPVGVPVPPGGRPH